MDTNKEKTPTFKAKTKTTSLKTKKLKNLFQDKTLS